MKPLVLAPTALQISEKGVLVGWAVGVVEDAVEEGVEVDDDVDGGEMVTLGMTLCDAEDDDANAAVLDTATGSGTHV